MRNAHRNDDVQRFVEGDLAFHATPFEAVHNVFFDALFAPLSSVSRTVRTETSSVADIRAHAIGWHSKILEAVTAGDPAAAREAMRRHLFQTEEDSEQYLADDRGD